MLYQSERHQPKVLRHSRQHPSQLVHGGILVAVGTSDFNISKTQHNLIKMWIGGVFFFIVMCLCVLYPCGNCGAPICCPGASTWHTTKCLVISCMSSLLKKLLKHSLSAAQQQGGRKWVEVYGERTEGYGKKDGVRGWRDGEQTLY